MNYEHIMVHLRHITIHDQDIDKLKNEFKV
jgi:hypothetical protein